MVSGVFVSEPYYDTRLKTFLIDFSTALLNRNGKEPIGFIVNRIKIEQREDSIRDGKSDEKDYSKLVAANKIRIIDFGSDGFIRDYAEEIIRKDERVFYYADLLNNHLCKNRQPLDPELLSVSVVNLDGEIISSTEIGQIRRNVSGEAYFTKTMKYGSGTGDLRRPQDISQNTFIDMARLIFPHREAGYPIGIIVNRYSGEFFEMVTHGKKPLEGMRETCELYIVNSDKLMLTGSRFEKNAVFKQIVDTEGVRAAFENGSGMIGIYPDYRGIPVVGASRYIEELDWVILAEKDVSEAFAPLIYLKNFSVIIAIIGTMVISAVAVFISRGITIPIRKLVIHTHNIAEGDLTEQIKVKSKDEIGLLASEFDTMRIKLDKSFKDVKDARRDWEITFNSVKDIIVIYGKDLKVTKCNNELLSRLNARPEDIIGRKCYEIFYDNEKERNEYKRDCEVIKTFKTIKPSTIERESSALHGIFLFSTFPRFDDEGRFAGVVQILRDITEQKRAQEKLIISYKMSSLGCLTAGVVHEILNPVNIISGHVQLLMMETEKGSKAEKDLESIREEIGRIVTISDGLLSFSRKEELTTEDVEINDLLEKVIIVVEPDMKLSNINFIRKFEDGLPKVMANSNGLRQVFLNMITNARDAMPEGGALTVKTKRVQSKTAGVMSSELGVKKKKTPRLAAAGLPKARQAGKLKGDSIEITFEDTGSGISKEILGLVFDPFFTTKMEGKGTGLGLSISYGIIRNHGGTISVESEEGKGTRFIIDLPVKNEDWIYYC